MTEPQKHGNRAFAGAYRKGREAYIAGVLVDECPYSDHRKISGKLTWSRAFRTAWRDGWQDAQAEDAKLSRDTRQGWSK